MKRKLITLFIALGAVFSLYAQEDSLRATRNALYNGRSGTQQRIRNISFSAGI